MSTEERELDHAPSLVDEREHTSEHPDPPLPNSEDARRKQIAIAAYHKAEQRGFEGNREFADWLEAEKQIDSLAAGAGAKNEASRLSSGESVVTPGNTELEPPQPAAERIESDEIKRCTLGSGNHYLEVQEITTIFDEKIAGVFGLKHGDIVVMIHCGSRGLGHQIGTEFLKRMTIAASQSGITLPDRELACAPINSDVEQDYLGAMRAAINCALANRQILTHLIREVFAGILPKAGLLVLYDVSHNTCKVEEHRTDGVTRKLYVHRKGATRAFGPGHPDIPESLREAGQPVLIGGSMGTGSYVLAGTKESESRSFSSACHGAGRAMNRHQAMKTWKGRQVVDELAARGILIKSPSMRGIC